MSTSDRTLLKPPENRPTDPAEQLDDASDRVIVLAGRVIAQLRADDEPDREDLDDLRAAVDDVDDALEAIDPEAE